MKSQLDAQEGVLKVLLEMAPDSTIDALVHYKDWWIHEHDPSSPTHERTAARLAKFISDVENKASHSNSSH